MITSVDGVIAKNPLPEVKAQKEGVVKKEKAEARTEEQQSSAYRVSISEEARRLQAAQEATKAMTKIKAKPE